jgi:hypothetical protein
VASSFASADHPSLPVASPWFHASASELLSALKALDAFRKASRFPLSPVFFSDSGAGITVQAFRQKEAFLAWLPSGSIKGSFSLPFEPLFSFVKSTKGKDRIFWNDAIGPVAERLSASDGSAILLSMGESLESSATYESEKLFREVCNLETIASEPATVPAFPLLPFLTVAGFAAKDEAKAALCGAGFRNGAFCATQGHYLRKASADLPTLPSAGSFPAEAWLPSWLASVVSATEKPAKRQNLLAFLWPEKQSLQALRFFSSSGLCFVIRFEPQSNFPQYDQLFPSQSFSFSFQREAMLSTVDRLLSSLKSSDGLPNVDLTLDGAVDQLLLSVELFRDTKEGSKYSPSLESIGKQEASLSVRFQNHPIDPIFSAGFFEKSEADQEAARVFYDRQRILTLNLAYLQKILKSFDDAILTFSYTSATAPITIGRDDQEKALIMPVQKRR